MRAIVNAEAFSDALNRAITTPYGSKYVPELNGVYIHFDGEKCTLASSNLESWLVTELPADGGEFSFVLMRPAAVARACRYFSGKLVLEYRELVAKGQLRILITMSCGARAGEFEALPSKDYPELPQPVEGGAFSTCASSLLDRVKRVQYAALKPGGSQNQQDRMSIQFRGNHVFAVDGHRMAWDSAGELAIPREFMVRADLLSCLVVFEHSEVRFHVGTRNLQITDGVTSLFLPIPPERVYHFEDAIPEKMIEQFYVCPIQFLQELAYLEQFSPKGKRLCVRMCGGVLSVNAQAESYRTEIEICGCNKVAVGFDLSYMKDALKQFRNADWITVGISGELSPIVLGAEGRDDHALILPVRLKQTQWAA